MTAEDDAGADREARRVDADIALVEAQTRLINAQAAEIEAGIFVPGGYWLVQPRSAAAGTSPSSGADDSGDGL